MQNHYNLVYREEECENRKRLYYYGTTISSLLQTDIAAVRRGRIGSLISQAQCQKYM